MERILWLAALLFAAGALSAADLQPHEGIAACARAFAETQAKAYGSRIHVEAGPIDPRLRLPRCRKMEAFYPPGERRLGSVTVGVRCLAPRTWTVYVPVNIAVTGKVLVARRYLPRGTRLRLEDFRLEERPLTHLPLGYMDDPQRLVGKRLKRPLPMGGVLRPSMLDIPPAVRRGAQVTLLYRGASFTVKAQGKALGRGKEGEQVKVRNLSSGRIVEGRIIAPGLVQVGDARAE